MQLNVEIGTITDVHFKNERLLLSAFSYLSDDESKEHETQEFDGYDEQSDEDIQQRLNDVVEHLSDDDELEEHSFRDLVLLGGTSLARIVTQKFIEKDKTATAADIKSLVQDNVGDEKLAKACVDCNLDNYIIYNQCKHESQLKQQIANFKTEAASYPINCKGMIKAPKIAADVVRSLLGAILIDSRYNDDTMYGAFEKICCPLITKEKPALNRAAFSALQKPDIQKTAKNPERAHEASPSQRR